MAYIFDHNLSPSTGSIVVYRLKQLLKTAGWTVMSSSDGTTYNSSGDQITSGSSGSGGYGNNSAWFRIRMPLMDGVTREFIFQRGLGTDTSLRMKYSYSAGFTGGSPSATQTPSATDEQYVTGGGTDAAPSFAALFAANGTYKANIIAGGENEGYVFVVLTPANSNTTVSSTTWYLERMQANTYPQSDPDPYVMGGNATNPTSSNISSATSIIKGWLGKGTSIQGFVSIAPGFPSDTTTTFVNNLGLNANTRQEDLLPMIYARRSALGSPAGYKGIGSMLRWNSYFHGSSGSMSITKVISINSTNDYIIVGDLVAPWNGSTPIT